jgi:hypothetical protein
LKPLYKSTIIIWSEYDPSALDFELSELAHEAETGDAYCSSMTCSRVAEPEKHPAWDGTEFFDEEDDEDDDDQCANTAITGKDGESTR